MRPEIPDEKPIILFDGVCNLCTGVVQFIIPRDPEGIFHFAPLQSEAGQELLERFDLPTDDFGSFILVEGDEYHTKSTAALRIATRLGGVYAWLYPFRFVPRVIRDGIYDVVADHRYQWFGRKDQCMMPSPEIESRFLE